MGLDWQHTARRGGIETWEASVRVADVRNPVRVVSVVRFDDGDVQAKAATGYVRRGFAGVAEAKAYLEAQAGSVAP